MSSKFQYTVSIPSSSTVDQSEHDRRPNNYQRGGKRGGGVNNGVSGNDQHTSFRHSPNDGFRGGGRGGARGGKPRGSSNSYHFNQQQHQHTGQYFPNHQHHQSDRLTSSAPSIAANSSENELGQIAANSNSDAGNVRTIKKTHAVSSSASPPSQSSSPMDSSQPPQNIYANRSSTNTPSSPPSQFEIVAPSAAVMSLLSNDDDNDRHFSRDDASDDHRSVDSGSSRHYEERSSSSSIERRKQRAFMHYDHQRAADEEDDENDRRAEAERRRYEDVGYRGRSANNNGYRGGRFEPPNFPTNTRGKGGGGHYDNYNSSRGSGVVRGGGYRGGPYVPYHQRNNNNNNNNYYNQQRGNSNYNNADHRRHYDNRYEGNIRNGNDQRTSSSSSIVDNHRDPQLPQPNSEESMSVSTLQKESSSANGIGKNSGVDGIEANEGHPPPSPSPSMIGVIFRWKDLSGEDNKKLEYSSMVPSCSAWKMSLFLAYSDSISSDVISNLKMLNGVMDDDEGRGSLLYDEESYKQIVCARQNLYRQHGSNSEAQETSGEVHITPEWFRLRCETWSEGRYESDSFPDNLADVHTLLWFNNG